MRAKAYPAKAQITTPPITDVTTMYIVFWVYRISGDSSKIVM